MESGSMYNQNDPSQNSWNFNSYYDCGQMPSNDFNNNASTIQTLPSEFTSGPQYGQWGTYYDGSTNQPVESFEVSTNQPVESFDGSTNQPVQPFDGSTNQPYQPFDGSTNQPYQPFDGSTNQPFQPFDFTASQPIQTACRTLDDKYNYEMNTETPVYADISRSTAIGQWTSEQGMADENYLNCSSFRNPNVLEVQNANNFPSAGNQQYENRPQQVFPNMHTTPLERSFIQTNNEPMAPNYPANQYGYSRPNYNNPPRRSYEENITQLGNTYTQANQYGRPSWETNIVNNKNMYGQPNIQRPGPIPTPLESNVHRLQPSNYQNSYPNTHGLVQNPQPSVLPNTQAINSNTRTANATPHPMQYSQGSYTKGGTFLSAVPSKRSLETSGSSDFRLPPPSPYKRPPPPPVDPYRNSRQSRYSNDSQRDRTSRRYEQSERSRRADNSFLQPRPMKREATPFPDAKVRKREGTPAPWKRSPTPQVPPIQMTGTMRDFLALRQLSNANQTTANKTSGRATPGPISQARVPEKDSFVRPQYPSSGSIPEVHIQRNDYSMTSSDDSKCMREDPSPMASVYRKSQTSQINAQANHPSTIPEPSMNKAEVTPSMATGDRRLQTSQIKTQANHQTTMREPLMNEAAVTSTMTDRKSKASHIYTQANQRNTICEPIVNRLGTTSSMTNVERISQTGQTNTQTNYPTPVCEPSMNRGGTCSSMATVDTKRQTRRRNAKANQANPIFEPLMNIGGTSSSMGNVDTIQNTRQTNMQSNPPNTIFKSPMTRGVVSQINRQVNQSATISEPSMSRTGATYMATANRTSQASQRNAQASHPNPVREPPMNRGVTSSSSMATTVDRKPPSAETLTSNQANVSTTLSDPGMSIPVLISHMTTASKTPQRRQINRRAQAYYPTSLTDTSWSGYGGSGAITTQDIAYTYQEYGGIKTTESSPGSNTYPQSVEASPYRSVGTNHLQDQTSYRLQQSQDSNEYGAHTKKKESVLEIFKHALCSRFPQCEHVDCLEASLRVEHMNKCVRLPCHVCKAVFDNVNHAEGCKNENCNFNNCRAIKKAQKDVDSYNSLEEILHSFEGYEDERTFETFDADEVQNYMDSIS